MENGSLRILPRICPKLDELLEVDPDLRRVIAEVFPHQLQRESVVARRHRRVRGEDIARRDHLQRGVEIELVLLHLAADQLQREKRRVPFIHVVDRRLDAHRVQRMDAADAEHDLLLDPHLVIAAVKLRGDLAVLLRVLRQIRIEQDKA